MAQISIGLKEISNKKSHERLPGGGGEEGTPYNGLYEEVPSERSFSVFGLAVYKTVGILRVKV